MGEESQETPTHQRVSRQLATSETRLANFNRMLHVSELLVPVGNGCVWHVCVCVCGMCDPRLALSRVSFRSVPRISNSAREMQLPSWAPWMSCSTGWRKRWNRTFCISSHLESWAVSNLTQRGSRYSMRAGDLPGPLLAVMCQW